MNIPSEATDRQKPLKRQLSSNLKYLFLSQMMSAKQALLIASIFLLSLCLEGVAAQRSSKIIRAKRNVVLKGFYFVSVVESEDISSVIKELTDKEKNGSFPPGFKMEIHGNASEVAHGFFARFSEVALNEITKNDKVESIFEDHIMKGGSALPSPAGEATNVTTAAAANSSTPFTRIVTTWGLDRLDQDSIRYDHHYTTPCGLTGKGVDVYVLDSGIFFEHKEFQGRASSPGCDPIDQIFNTSKNGADFTGHGTHVAGTVGGKKFGVAPGVNLFSVRVLDTQNSGSANSLVLGAECVVKSVERRKRPSIVNLSIYGDKNLLVKRALDTLMRKGITVIGIAGNSKTKPKNSCKVGPGSIQGIITASASTKSDEPLMYSNAGTCVDLYAPGSEILSASTNCKNCRSTRQGSSMAAPHVTGAVALLLEKCPTMKPWRVKYILRSQMTKENKLNFSRMPRIYQSMTPNLLLHTSSLQCDLEC